MSVKKSLTTVTLMLHAPTFLEALPVFVIKDTVEMESTVLVCEDSCTNLYLYLYLIMYHMLPKINFINRY